MLRPFYYHKFIADTGLSFPCQHDNICQETGAAILRWFAALNEKSVKQGTVYYMTLQDVEKSLASGARKK